MKRFIAITILMLGCLAWLTGCSNIDQTTAPPTETSIIDQVNTASQNGGFETVMNVASQSVEDGPTWRGVQSVLKTADPDTIVLSHSHVAGYPGGYYSVTFYQTIYTSGEVRGYNLPFDVDTSDANGWTFISSGLGSVYNSEPGYPFGWTGLDGGTLLGMHVKVGWDYPAWVTSGEYAWFTVRNNTPYLSRAPRFTGIWDTANVKVRDPDNVPIYDYVLMTY